MSFNILKLQSEFTVCISRYKNQYNKTRPSPNLAIKILFQTNERNNSPKSKNGSYSSSTSIPNQTTKTSPLLTQTNTIGIIGGVSALSTLNFAEKLVKWSSKDGEEKSLPFVICSDPLLKKKLSCCGSSFHLGTKYECLNLDFRPITENLRSKKAYLEQSGARCIVMPCHISHIWHGEISQGCSVPFLHVGDCVVKELKEAKLKPLEAGSNLRIGVLSTDATLTAGFYQEKLQDQGFEVVLPDKATMEHTVIPAIEALNRKDMEGARNLLRIALQVLIVRAVNTVILASDDMRDLLPSDDPLLKKCIDPMDSLVRSTIRWAQSTEFASKNS